MLQKNIIVTRCLHYFVFFVVTSFPAYGSILRHNILLDDSADSYQTQGVCYAFYTTPTRLMCLPLPYVSQKSGRIQFDFLLKNNDRAFTILRKTHDKDINQDFLDRMFKEENFQQSSGTASVRAVYRNTSLTYTPIHFMGAFKLVNPSLPIINISGVKEDVLMLSHYFLIDQWIGGSYGEILLAPSIFLYNRTYFDAEFDLLSTVGQKPEQFIAKENQRSYDGALNLSLLSQNWYLPSVTVKAENLMSDHPCPDCTERFFDLRSYYYQRSSYGLNFFKTHYVGKSLVGIVIPYWGLFDQLDYLKIAGSYVYRLSKLHTFISFSAIMRSFGFMFESDNYRVGLQYTNEKQDNSIQIERTNHTYVYASFYL